MRTRRHHNNKGYRQIKTGSYLGPIHRLQQELRARRAMTPEQRLTAAIRKELERADEAR